MFARNIFNMTAAGIVVLGIAPVGAETLTTGTVVRKVDSSTTKSSAMLNRKTLDRQFEERMGHWKTAGIDQTKIDAAQKLHGDAMAAMEAGDAKLGSQLQFDIPKLITAEEWSKVKDAIKASKAAKAK
jgi:hypothetical protein